MDAKKYRDEGKALAEILFVSFEPIFMIESFYNATEMKRWFGPQIKSGFVNGYRNLEWRDYKTTFDLILSNQSVYRVGIDFGQQAVHVTLGPEDVYSLYYRNPSVPE